MQHIASCAADPRSVMPRHTNPKDLTINLKAVEAQNATPERPISSPIALEGIDLSSIEGAVGLTSLPALPSSPPTSPGRPKEPSKNILNSFRPGKPRDRSKDRPLKEQQDPRSHARQVRDDDEYRPGSSSMSKIYHLRKAPGSTPELSLVGSAENVAKSSNEDASIERRPQPSPHYSEDSTISRKKEKAFRNPLTRTKSLRRDSNSKSSRPTNLHPPSYDQPPNTAPLNSEWSKSDMNLLKGKGKDRRGKSAERLAHNASEENLAYQAHAATQPKEKNAFMSGSKNVLGKAKTGGGNFLTRLGKIGRSSSNSEKEVPDSEYQLKVITLPLLEQTRKTRISKKIESSKDKTEYWMPSLPWRCIDYLNLNCESEGLYRVPGSGPQVKHWQRRFDQELDVDLLDEQELYDPNTIGSMLKQWLRELPTEIFPQALQNNLSIELEKDNPEYMKMGQSAPQKLRDALSELPPFNYYLLFAITCHLSLLLSHQDRNRMDLNNLSICIGPCLRMERWLFNYLVGDWRHCWQGCWTEKQTLEDENHIQDPTYVPPQGPTQSRNNLLEGMQNMEIDERAVSSGGDSNSTINQRTAPADEPRERREESHSKPQSRNQSSSRPARPAREDSANGSRPRENAKVNTYVPMGMHAAQPHVNGNAAATAVGHELRRPSTAENRAAPGLREQPTFSSAASSPRPKGHGRSQSDLPLSPSQAGFPDPFSGR